MNVVYDTADAHAVRDASSYALHMQCRACQALLLASHGPQVTQLHMLQVT